MRENKEDWKKQLSTVIIEVAGLNEIFVQQKGFLTLLAKLEGILAQSEMPFDLYRKTVFESLSLLQELKKCL